MMAYRAAGINIARTSEQQWATEVRVPAALAQPGDLVFFAGADGTPTSPGHVGLVIGNGKMIEAYATGFPIRVATYTSRDTVGFTRPGANASAGAGAHLGRESCPDFPFRSPALNRLPGCRVMPRSR
jgi:cell wall-associated NlpC family hydrolase